MTHDNSKDHDQASDIDEHLIAKLPWGVHFDSLEGKWLLVGVATAFVMALTGSTELLAVVGPVALGLRTAKPSRLPKLARLEAQPWWWVGGLMAGFPIATGVRTGLQRLGVTMPDVDWAVAMDLILRFVQGVA